MELRNYLFVFYGLDPKTKTRKDKTRIRDYTLLLVWACDKILLACLRAINNNSISFEMANLKLTFHQINGIKNKNSEMNAKEK